MGETRIVANQEQMAMLARQCLPQAGEVCPVGVVIVAQDDRRSPWQCGCRARRVGNAAGIGQQKQVWQVS